MIRITFFLITMSFLVFACNNENSLGSQINLDQVGKNTKTIDFRKAVRIIPSFDVEKERLSVSVDLSEEVHAYAPGEKIGKPVELKVLDRNGWKMASDVLMPQGTKKKLLSKEESRVLEDDFSVSVKVSGGKGRLFGELQLQICSIDACDRPRTHSFEVETRLGSDRG